MNVAAGRPAALRLLAFLALLASLIAGCAAPQGEQGGRAESSGIVPVAGGPGSNEETDERRRARIRVELAANYYQQRNYPVALDELGQALRADPDYAEAYGMLGLVYMDLGDTTRAGQSFEHALRLSPADPDLNNNYGWFLCQDGREREALEFFGRALSDPLYRTPAKPLHNAGICSLKIGDEASAESYFQRAFQVDPSNPVAMFNLGEMYLKRGDYERARFHAQRLVGSFEPAPQTLWLALKVERARGDRDAEASLEAQLRRLFPASAEAGLLAAGRYSD
jgi:type IV pilus assembly protein PilF